MLVNYLLMAAEYFFPFFYIVLYERATVQSDISNKDMLILDKRTWTEAGFDHMLLPEQKLSEVCNFACFILKF